MLSVNLDAFEKAITFQIVEQDQKITDAITKYGPFTASNGWSIKIENAPELDIATKTIFLRGRNSSLDKRVDRTWDLKDNYSRDKYISQADNALNELVQSLASQTIYPAAYWIPTPISVGSANCKTCNKPLIKG